MTRKSMAQIPHPLGRMPVEFIHTKENFRERKLTSGTIPSLLQARGSRETLGMRLARLWFSGQNTGLAHVVKGTSVSHDHPSQTFIMSSHAGDKLDTLIKFTLQNISDEGFIGNFAKKYGFLGIPVGLAVILIIALACSARGTGKK